MDALGSLYDVHRATAARWLRSAHEDLGRATRERLATRLRIAPDELASIMQMIESRLEVSLERLLDRSDAGVSADEDA